MIDGNLYQTMGIFTKRWESLPKDGNLYQKMRIFTKRWESLPKDENLYQKMGILIFTKRWESLPKDGNLNIYQKMGIFTKRWESLPKDGNLYQKMGIFTKRWESLPKDGNLYQKMGILIFTKRWESLPKYGNLYQKMGIFTPTGKYLREISIPLRVWNSEIYLWNWCIFDTQTNPEIYIYIPPENWHVPKKGAISKRKESSSNHWFSGDMLLTTPGKVEVTSVWGDVQTLKPGCKLRWFVAL